MQPEKQKHSCIYTDKHIHYLSWDLITGHCVNQVISLSKIVPSDAGVHKAGSWEGKMDVK